MFDEDARRFPLFLFATGSIRFMHEETVWQCRMRRFRTVLEPDPSDASDDEDTKRG